MIDSIIFDIDGTLLDSRAQVRVAWSRMVEELSGAPWDISDKDFTGLFGQPMDVIAQKLFPNETDPAEQLRKADLCYEAENQWLLTHHTTLFPDVPRVLQQLSKQYPLYIVSNCQSGYIQAAIGPHGLLPLFSGWLCFGDTGTPKGTTIRRLMEQHSLQNPVYVGDTQGDLQACRDANIPFVFAEYGFGNADCPDETIRQFGDLISLYGKEN